MADPDPHLSPDPLPALPRRRLPRGWPLALVALAAVLGWWLLSGRLTFEALRDSRDALEAVRDRNYLLTVAGFMALYTVVVALSLPGATVMTLTGGFLFSTWPGVAWNLIAATCGATLLFLAIRAGIGRSLAARLDAGGGRIARIKRGLDRNQWSMLFFIRLVPVIPFFAANLLPGLLDVPLHRFVVSTALGVLPAALVYTSVGAGLGQVLDAGGRPDLGVIFEAHILLPLLGLAALSLLPVLLRRGVSE